MHSWTAVAYNVSALGMDLCNGAQLTAVKGCHVMQACLRQWVALLPWGPHLVAHQMPSAKGGRGLC